MSATVAESPARQTPHVVASGMSWEQFLSAPEFYGRPLEWVAGEVIEKVSTSREHADVTGFLLLLLRFVARKLGLGQVYSEQYLMRLEDQQRGRMPDILFVSNANASRVQSSHLAGPADLAVEVVSPGSEIVDRGNKYDEYESGGVREYWLIDPRRREAFFYVRGQDGLFHAAPLENGVFQSVVLPPVRLRVQWLWDLPIEDDVLREWNLI